MPDFWQHGPTIGVLSILLAAIWQGGRFLAPRLDKVLDRHIAFLDAMERKFEGITNHIENQSQIMDKLILHAKEMEDLLARLEVCIENLTTNLGK